MEDQGLLILLLLLGTFLSQSCPLKAQLCPNARRSLFPDWLWPFDESSPHIRALHIPAQILVGKFKMEFLPTVSH